MGSIAIDFKNIPNRSLQMLSPAATARFRSVLLAAREEVQRRISARLGDQLHIGGNTVWLTDPQHSYVFPGQQNVVHRLVILDRRVVESAPPKNVQMLIAHESLHIYIAEQILFAVAERFPGLWGSVREVLEASLPEGGRVLSPQNRSSRFDVEGTSPWLGEEVSRSLIRELGAPKYVSTFIEGDLRGAEDYIESLDREEQKDYFRYLAIERAALAFDQYHGLFSWTHLFLEEAYINCLVPWLLGYDFEEMLHAYPIDQPKVELSRKVHNHFIEREQELLLGLNRKGEGLVSLIDSLGRMIEA